MTEEEEIKNGREINPDVLEAVFEESIIEESVVFFAEEENEDEGVDIAFLANDEGYW